jgi:hypothetical protein
LFSTTYTSDHFPYPLQTKGLTRQNPQTKEVRGTVCGLGKPRFLSAFAIIVRQKPAMTGKLAKNIFLLRINEIRSKLGKPALDRWIQGRKDRVVLSMKLDRRLDVL